MLQDFMEAKMQASPPPDLRHIPTPVREHRPDADSGLLMTPPSEPGDDGDGSKSKAASAVLVQKSLEQMRSQLAEHCLQLDHLNSAAVEAEDLRRGSITLRSKLAASEMEVEEKERFLTEVQAQLQERDQDLIEARKTTAQKVDELALQKGQLQQQQRALEELEARAASAQAQAEKEASENEAQNNTLRNKLAASEMEVEEKECFLTEVQAQIQERDQDLLEARQTTAQKVDEVAVQKGQIDQQQRALEELEARAASAQAQAEKVASENEVVVRENLEISERYATAAQELAAQREVAAQQQGEITYLQGAAKQAVEQAESLRITKDDLEKGRKQVSVELEVAKLEAKTLKAQSVEREAEHEREMDRARLAVEEERARLKQAERDGEDLRKAMTTELEASAQEVQARTDELATERELTAFLQTKILDLEAAVANEKSQAEGQRLECNALEAEHRATTQQFEDLRAEYAEARGKNAMERAMYQKELAGAGDMIKQQQDEMKELEGMVADVREEMEQQCAAYKGWRCPEEVSQLSEQLHQAEDKVAQLDHELAVQNAEVSRLVGEQHAYQQNSFEQGVRIQKQLEEVKELATQVSSLEQALSVSQSRQEELETQVEGAAQACSAQKHVLQAEISQLRSALEASRAEAQIWRERAQEGWENLRLQNRELSLTLQQFKQDCELVETENSSLRDAMAMFDEDFENNTDNLAKLAGHTNHKQKIRYTMKLKEEINRLFGELKKARQRIVQLECGREGEGLLDALISAEGASVEWSVASRRNSGRASSPCGQASTAGANSRPAAGQRRRSGQGTPSTPAVTGTAVQARVPGSAGPIEQLNDLRAQEAEHRLERMGTDFQHMRALIERFVMLADSNNREGGGSSAGFAALLQRLRDLIAHAQDRRKSNRGAQPVEDVAGNGWSSTMPCPGTESREDLVGSDTSDA